MAFTKDELTLISIYNTGERISTMEEIQRMRMYLEEDETELYELTVSVLKKLGDICDDTFDSLDLLPDFEN